MGKRGFFSAVEFKEASRSAVDNKVRKKGEHQDNDDQKRDDRKRVKQTLINFEIHTQGMTFRMRK